MMLVMWVLHQAIFDILVIPLVLVVLVVGFGGAKDKERSNWIMIDFGGIKC